MEETVSLQPTHCRSGIILRLMHVDSIAGQLQSIAGQLQRLVDSLTLLNLHGLELLSMRLGFSNVPCWWLNPTMCHAYVLMD